MTDSDLSPRRVTRVKMWAWALAWACLLNAMPTSSLFVPETEGGGSGAVVQVLSRMIEVLETQERHTALYERVALLEDNLNKKTETEVRLESEVLQLRAKIPALEEEIKTIPEMRKDLAEFQAKIEKLVHDYEAKLSTLASEVIRLKKYGARTKDFQTLSDGSKVLLRRAPSCPEVGLGMVAERVGEQCLYFPLGLQLNWTSAHRRCQELGGDLAAPQDLVPLKTFLHQAFVRGPSLWLGASYALNDIDTTSVDSIVASQGSPNGFQEDKKNSSGVTQDTSINQRSSSHSLEDSRGDIALVQDQVVLSSPPDNMLLDEGHSDNVQAAGETAGSWSRVLDEAMFNEDFVRNGGIISAPRRLSKPQQSSLKLAIRDSPGRQGLEEMIRDASVVDFILLEESVDSAVPPVEASNDQNLPEYSNPDERSVSGTLADIHLDAASTQPRNSSDERSLLGHEVRDTESGGGLETQETNESKGAKKARMKCMLLQQKESLEYELIGRPCDELHTFVCDMKFAFDNLLHE
nr:uncharacterized protein LOC123768641 isoform X2 [Procambarus clarkii]